jgi:hypothetical protein
MAPILLLVDAEKEQMGNLLSRIRGTFDRRRMILMICPKIWRQMEHPVKCCCLFQNSRRRYPFDGRPRKILSDHPCPSVAIHRATCQLFRVVVVGVDRDKSHHHSLD